MTCKNCGTTLSAINKCYNCSNGEQSVKIEAPSYRGRKMLIIKIGLAAAFSIITIIISSVAIFDLSAKPFLVILNLANTHWIMLACIPLIIAVFNFVTAVFIPKLKKWTFQIYFAFIILNWFISLIVFIVSRIETGIGLST